MKSKVKILSLVIGALMIQCTTSAYAADKKTKTYSKEELQSLTPGWSDEDKSKSEYNVNSYTNTFSGNSATIQTSDKTDSSSSNSSDKNSSSKDETKSESSFDVIGPESAKTNVKYEQSVAGSNKKWLALEDNTWMLTENNNVLTGWQYVGGTWYYMNPNGIMATGWICPNGTWYYLYSYGGMATNTYIGNYYVDSTGAMR